jgi:stage III sporulation protein AB
MLGSAADRLRYLSPSMQGLLRQLAAQYPLLSFLASCRDSMADGKPFPESWREALQEKTLPVKAREILLPLADELGGADLDSQLSALRYAISRLGELAAREQEYLNAHGKLYRSLGALAGIALAILLY